jgi:hypothetical protein
MQLWVSPGNGGSPPLQLPPLRRAPAGDMTRKTARRSSPGTGGQHGSLVVGWLRVGRWASSLAGGAAGELGPGTEQVPDLLLQAVPQGHPRVNWPD